MPLRKTATTDSSDSLRSARIALWALRLRANCCRRPQYYVLKIPLFDLGCDLKHYPAASLVTQGTIRVEVAAVDRGAIEVPRSVSNQVFGRAPAIAAARK